MKKFLSKFFEDLFEVLNAPDDSKIRLNKPNYFKKFPYPFIKIPSSFLCNFFFQCLNIQYWMNQINQNNDMNLSKQPTQPQSLEPQQKPIQQLMQENNRMNTLGQNIQASQMPSMPGMGPGSSRFAGGFENPSAKATGFYSAARDFV